VRTGSTLAAAGGVVLLVAMFLSWYGYDVSGGAPGVAEAAADRTSNAWQMFAWIDLLLALAAVVAIAWGALGASAPALIRRETVLAAGLLATALIVYRLVDLPVPEIDSPLVTVRGTREAGAFVALLGSLLTMFGAVAQRNGQDRLTRS
jgi:hypothetical protein